MTTAPSAISILSYNIHKGFSAGKRRFVLREMKEAIGTLAPDIVFLQEVHGEHRGHAERIADWPKNPQAEFFAEALWPHFAYGKNRAYVDGHHGNALLSRYPIRTWQNVDVSAHRFEGRGLLHAEIDVPGLVDPLHAVCVHLGLSQVERRYQIQQIVRLVKEEIPSNGPLVVAGDFNDWSLRASKVLARTLHAHEIFKRHGGRHARTFPSFFPVLHLDRVYVRGFGVEKTQVLSGKVWGKLSDHAALFAVLLPEAQAGDVHTTG
ncbi:MAG: endonuclease/exonuclease/phosphatase family protein [Bdellovibrionota bacterium]